MLTKLGELECSLDAETGLGSWYRCGCSVWTAKFGKEMGAICTFSSWPVGFCVWPARVGEPMVHEGVAIFVLRGPRGDGRAGV